MAERDIMRGVPMVAVVCGSWVGRNVVGGNERLEECGWGDCEGKVVWIGRGRCHFYGREAEAGAGDAAAGEEAAAAETAAAAAAASAGGTGGCKVDGGAIMM